MAQTENQSYLLQREYGRNPTYIIRNFHPLPKECIDKTGPITVLWVANFKRLKQPEVFIRLARDLRDIQNVRFIMVGRPPSGGSWNKSIMDQLTNLKNLTYLGEKKQEDVNLLLAQSHIVVNTSQWEGFSNVFIQAWMRRVPVVALNVNPDGIFDNGYVGYCAQGSYEILREHVTNLLHNPQLIESIGQRAQEHASKYYLEENVDQLIKLLDG